MTRIPIYILIFALTFAGVEFFRRWSWRRRLLDVPNERSSHTNPTPRGGGLLIVVVGLTVYTFSTVFWFDNFQWSYALGAASIALISWLDDLYTISFIWRLAIQTISAVSVVLTLGFFDAVYLPIFGDVRLGIFGVWLTLLWIVWLTNAYNFMDGIDGIAGLQAVTAGIGWLLIGNCWGLPSVGFYGGALAAASFGFLLHNWQPAKVFMGDVGSAFLGFTFAVLPILAKSETNSDSEKFLLPVAVIFVWLFVFDTVWTFGRRLSGGEKVWQAHRGHLYQRLVGGNLSHQSVSLLYGGLTLANGLLLMTFLGGVKRESWLLIFVAVQSIGLLIGSYYIGAKKSK